MDEKYIYLAAGAIGGIIVGAAVTAIIKNNEMTQLALELSDSDKEEKTDSDSEN